MHASAQDHALAVGDLILGRHEIGDNEHLNRIASFCLAEGSASESVFTVSRQTDSLQKEDAIGVRVWVAVSEVDLVLVVRKLHRKA